VPPKTENNVAEKHKLLVLPGDGIGPEVIREVKRVMDWMARHRDIHFELDEDLIGGASIDAHGVPLTDAVLEKAKAAEAVLLGAVGGPKWDSQPMDKRPEAALIRLRRELGLFANLRPIKAMPALRHAGPLDPLVVDGADILIVRELTGGIYFSEPKEIRDGDPVSAVDTQDYTVDEIRRVARVAFEEAMKRGKKVHSVEKSNVMASGRLWRQEVTALAKEFPKVELHHMYADNCGYQLIKSPRQFDVVLCDNLFGDVLSDVAGNVAGSLAMLPSASLGASGSRVSPALYEPVHGAANDIAGREQANPVGAILSFCMALAYSFDMPDEGSLVEQAINAVLAGGLRSGDVMEPKKAKVSSGVLGDAIVRELDKIAL